MDYTELVFYASLDLSDSWSRLILIVAALNALRHRLNSMREVLLKYNNNKTGLYSCRNSFHNFWQSWWNSSVFTDLLLMFAGEGITGISCRVTFAVILWSKTTISRSKVYNLLKPSRQNTAEAFKHNEGWCKIMWRQQWAWKCPRVLSISPKCERDMCYVSRWMCFDVLWQQCQGSHRWTGCF